MVGRDVLSPPCMPRQEARTALGTFFFPTLFSFSACGVFLMTSVSVPSLFSVLCLAASSPMPFPPPGPSSLSCLGPDSSSSPRNPWLALGSKPDSRPRVTLLPPFLSDQAQHVHALGTFHLFCQATGERGTCPGGGWGFRGLLQQHYLSGCIPQ